jgi:hypothetical protein
MQIELRQDESKGGKWAEWKYKKKRLKNCNCAKEKAKIKITQHNKIETRTSKALQYESGGVESEGER